jgi:hypothetical protein
MNQGDPPACVSDSFGRAVMKLDPSFGGDFRASWPAQGFSVGLTNSPVDFFCLNETIKRSF